MGFEIIERGETLVAGLPVRSPQRALGELSDPRLDRAWTRVLHHEVGGPLASTYIDFAPDVESYYTQIVGYECATVDDATRGHVISRIPPGTYAKFSSRGMFPDVMLRLWAQVSEAETNGDIERTYTGDLEAYPHAYAVDLYIPIHVDESGAPSSAVGSSVMGEER